MNRTLAPFGFVTLLAGCPLLEVEAELGEVCLTYRGVEVEGLTADRMAGSFVFDELAEIHDLLALDPELRFVRAAIRANTDALAIDRATITIASADPDATLPTLPAYACDGDCPARDGTIAIPATTGTSALPYVAEDAIVVGLDLEGALPTTAWTMDVDVCVEGALAYRVEP